MDTLGTSEKHEMAMGGAQKGGRAKTNDSVLRRHTLDDGDQGK